MEADRVRHASSSSSSGQHTPLPGKGGSGGPSGSGGGTDLGAETMDHAPNASGSPVACEACQQCAQMLKKSKCEEEFESLSLDLDVKNVDLLFLVSVHSDSVLLMPGGVAMCDGPDTPKPAFTRAQMEVLFNYLQVWLPRSVKRLCLLVLS